MMVAATATTRKLSDILAPESRPTSETATTCGGDDGGDDDGDHVGCDHPNRDGDAYTDNPDPGHGGGGHDNDDDGWDGDRQM